MSESSVYDPLPENTEAVLSRIENHHRVLDVGGWWKPFNRANYVVDYLPYETRGGGGFIGLQQEFFSKDSWFQLDICATSFPFEDKFFDFIYCGNILEDIRDPIPVCREMIRVGQAGYIECPRVWIECQFGIDDDLLAHLYPGFRNHRWLVDVTSMCLTFVPKLSILSALNFVSRDTFERFRNDHRMWSFGFFWEGDFETKIWIYPDREGYINYFRKYFETFDYENIRTLYGKTSDASQGST